MKWFRHRIGRDEILDLSESRFGSDGPWVYYKTIEILAEHFKIESPGRSIFTWDKFKSYYKIPTRRLKNILRFFDAQHRLMSSFWFEGQDEMIGLNSPELADLADEYTDRQLKKMNGMVETEEQRKAREQMEKAAGKKRLKGQEIEQQAKTILDELNSRLKKRYTDLTPIIAALKMHKYKYTVKDCRAVMWLQINDSWFVASKFCNPKGIWDKGKFESRLDNAYQQIQNIKERGHTDNGTKVLSMEDIMAKLK